MNNENQIVSKEFLDSLSRYKKIINRIVSESEDIVNSYFNIGSYLYTIKNEELYKLEEYNDIYEFAEDKFKFKSTSVKNMINVFLKYKDDNDELLENVQNYSYTSLVELLSVENSDIEQNYQTSMTISEIRETKKISQLTDEMKKHIMRFKEMIKMLETMFNKFNETVKSGDRINFKLWYEKINICNFEYVYYIDIGTYAFSELYYKRLELFVDGRIEYDRKDITHLTAYDIQQKFNNLIDKYSKFLKNKYEKDLKDKEEKKKQKELEKHEKKVQLYSCSLTRFNIEVINFIHNVLLDHDTYFSANYEYIRLIDKDTEDMHYVYDLIKDKNKFGELEIFPFIDKDDGYFGDLYAIRNSSNIYCFHFEYLTEKTINEQLEKFNEMFKIILSLAEDVIKK